MAYLFRLGTVQGTGVVSPTCREALTNGLGVYKAGQGDRGVNRPRQDGADRASMDGFTACLRSIALSRPVMVQATVLAGLPCHGALRRAEKPRPLRPHWHAFPLFSIVGPLFQPGSVANLRNFLQAADGCQQYRPAHCAGFFYTGSVVYRLGRPALISSSTGTVQF